MATNIEIDPRYANLEHIGTGMAAVYSADDTRFQRKVAIKIVTASQGPDPLKGDGLAVTW